VKEPVHKEHSIVSYVVRVIFTNVRMLEQRETTSIQNNSIFSKSITHTIKNVTSSESHFVKIYKQ